MDLSSTSPEKENRMKFVYKTTLTLEPRPGTNYATTYYKMTDQERQRMIEWLGRIAQDIIAITDDSYDWAAWMSNPLKKFRKSRRGEYYTPMELITDMLGQLIEGRDIPEAMIGRWNRLCGGTDWAISMTDQARPDAPLNRLVV